MNLCILQARMRSTRLPGKVLKRVRGKPLLEYEIRRLKLAKKINKIVVATGIDRANAPIAKLASQLGVHCFRGSEGDVLDRYYQAAKQYPEFQNIVRITGDCPLIDPVVVDEVIGLFEKGNYEYATNTMPSTYPDGMDVEIFKRNILAEAEKNARWHSEREHVTPYIRKSKKFKKGNLAASHDFSHLRLVVDNPEDFEVIKFLIQNSKPDAGYLHYISLVTKHPQVWLKNVHIQRNEGMRKSLKHDYVISKKQ